MTNKIHKYVKNDKGERVGVLMGSKIADGRVVITASKVATSKGDTFDKGFGKFLCTQRAVAFEEEGRIPKVAETMFDDVIDFEDRCKRYFKVDTVEMPLVAS